MILTISIIIILIVIGTVVWQGYVFSILWGWFVVPAFSIEPISIAMGVGLSTIGYMFTTGYTQKQLDEMELKESLPKLIGRLFGPLLIGYIAKSFI